jgi:hypothetical protein
MSSLSGSTRVPVLRKLPTRVQSRSASRSASRRQSTSNKLSTIYEDNGDFSDEARDRDYYKLDKVFYKIKQLIESKVPTIKTRMGRLLTITDQSIIRSAKSFNDVPDQQKENLRPVLYQYYRDLIPDIQPNHKSEAYKELYPDPNNSKNFELYEELKRNSKLGGKSRRNKRKTHKTKKRRKTMFSWF